jgi:transmembrane sensor
MNTPSNPTRRMSRAEAASWWFARIQRGQLEAAEERAFEAWLDTEGAAEAFDQARRAWALTGEAAELPRMRALRTAALARVRPRRTGPQWLPRAAGLAAALALLIGAGVVLGVVPLGAGGQGGGSLAQLGEPDFVTLVGERQAVSLPDGTVVTLNTDSALDVAFNGQVRVVRLTKGQAYFEVASDPEHPFMVEAAGRRIVALGTAFDVRLDPDRFQVVLAEGSVRIDRSPYAFGGGASAEQVVLRPGQGLIAQFGALEEVAEVDVARQLRWREGFVEFAGETLINVVAEMNRYATAPLSVQDPRVAELRVSGVFRTDDQSQFLNVISRVLPVAPRASSVGTTELVWSPPDERG